ncbi:hypothetical protein [Oceanobacillus kimchii]|uniref:hypothetical protein n=1 Tax=Oceanobacillus kimchii TaxID=746691 RepID=UPI003C77AF52
MLKKYKTPFLLFLTLLIIAIPLVEVSAHKVGKGGSESMGWIYKGTAHWSSQSTNYFDTGSTTWKNRFTNGVNKFKRENSSFNVKKVSAGSTQNFFEPYKASTATWVGRRTNYGVSNHHPTRWRIQFNSGKSANSWTTVGAHEIGHVFGLSDLYNSSNNKKLMYGYDNGSRTTQASDKRGFNYIY